MTPETEVVDVAVLAPSEVCEKVGGGVAKDGVGALVGTPLIAVDADDPDIDRVAAIARHLPCVVAGVGAMPRTLAHPPDLDVLLTGAASAPRPWRACPEGVEQALSTLADGVHRAPQAATMLVQVLRMGRDLSFDDALVAESLAYATLQSGSEFRTWLAAREPPRRRRPEAMPVEVTRHDRSLLVTLHRPRTRNAIDTATRDALVQAFDLAALDPTIERVDLRGAGPAFCAGGDLDEFGTVPDPVVGHLVRASRSPARAIARCADRTTAHVHGACVGAGIEMAALASRVVAASDAWFQLPEIGLGLIPGAGGTATIPRRIGRERTAWMALTGARIGLDTALDWGLIDIA